MSNFSLTVLNEINGVMTKVGSITGTDYKDAVFAYDESYIADKTHKSNRAISLSINGKLNMDGVTRADFELEAKSVGLGTKPAMKIFDEIQNGLLEALKACARELEEKGFAQAGEIADKIVRRGIIYNENRNK